MSYRSLRDARGQDAESYYLSALRYGNALWEIEQSGRAILAITRALYTDLPEEAAVFKDWPLPYKALRWIVATHPSVDFPGNPRVSFQHQATRMRGRRAPLLRARAWAVWALIREAKPELPGDASQNIEEPVLEDIFGQLKLHGHSTEPAIWQKALGNG
jgi:hypothetical protein